MKTTQMRTLAQHLKEKTLFPLYLFNCPDEYDRRHALEQGLHALRAAFPEIAVVIFENEELTLQSLAVELDGVSLFAPQKVLILKGIERLKGKLLQELERYCSAPHPSFYLLMSAAGLSASSTLYKTIEKQGAVLDIPDEKPWEREKSLANWLVHEAQVSGKSLPMNVAQTMVQQVGPNKELLRNELDKLLCYIGEHPAVSLQDFQAIGVEGDVELIWELGKVILQRQTMQAVKMVKKLMNPDSEPLALLAQLRSQIQRSMQVCSILARGGNASDVTKVFPYLKGAILEKNLELAQGYGLERFKKALLALYETELTFKSRSVSHGVLIERLIVRISS